MLPSASDVSAGHLDTLLLSSDILQIPDSLLDAVPIYSRGLLHLLALVVSPAFHFIITLHLLYILIRMSLLVNISYIYF